MQLTQPATIGSDFAHKRAAHPCYLAKTGWHRLCSPVAPQLRQAGRAYDSANPGGHGKQPALTTHKPHSRREWATVQDVVAG